LAPDSGLKEKGGSEILLHIDSYLLHYPISENRNLKAKFYYYIYILYSFMFTEGKWKYNDSGLNSKHAAVQNFTFKSLLTL